MTARSLVNCSLYVGRDYPWWRRPFLLIENFIAMMLPSCVVDANELLRDMVDGWNGWFGVNLCIVPCERMDLLGNRKVQSFFLGQTQSTFGQENNGLLEHLQAQNHVWLFCSFLHWLYGIVEAQVQRTRSNILLYKFMIQKKFMNIIKISNALFTFDLFCILYFSRGFYQ